MQRYLSFAGIGLLGGLLLAAVLAFTRPYQFHGSLIQDDVLAHEFTLYNGPEQEYRLADQRGRVVLIFFGFTHCPDVCPTTLATFKQVRERLGKDADRVQFVYITVDPERDTPEVSAQYAAAFDPAFVGLSGAEQQLAPVWKNYGVYRKIIKPVSGAASGGHGGHGAYDVEHSTQVYLVDPQGNLRLTYTYGAPVDDILQDVRQLLK